VLSTDSNSIKELLNGKRFLFLVEYEIKARFPLNDDLLFANKIYHKKYLIIGTAVYISHPEAQ
jgi:hypothetical protein